MNSWPDMTHSSVVWSVQTEISGRGFKSHSGQLSIATLKNPSVVNTIYIYIYTESRLFNFETKLEHSKDDVKANQSTKILSN